MATDLIYSTPEQEGISSAYILDFLKGMKDAQAEVHGIAVAVNGKVIFEQYQAPYAKDIPHTIHSLTKCFTNTAFGLAYTEGLVDLKDRVLKYFPQYEKDANDYLKSLTIRDLITMRSGQVRKVQGNEWRPLKTSWIDAYFHIPWDKQPGTKFLYSSGNSYIISAIVQKVTGMSCDAYIKEKLSGALGLRDFTWQKSPEGICSGGNGINICVDDMLRVGMLYLNGGVWNGRQLLSRHWVDLSLGYEEPVERRAGEPEYNYHWRHTGDVWTSRGKYGQACCLVPCLNMAVTVMMASKKHCAADMLQKYVIDPVRRGQAPAEDAKTNQEKLRAYASQMTLKVISGAVDTPVRFAPAQVLRYHAVKPVDTITDLTIELNEHEVILSVCDSRGIHTVKHGMNCWQDGYSSITGHYLHHQYEFNCMRICAAAYWISGHELMLEWRYPEMPFWDHIRITFFDDNSITMERWVNMNSEATDRPVLTAVLTE